MRTERKLPALVVGVASALLAAVIAGGVFTAFAQTGSSETDRREAYLQGLANRLGVDVETLKQAIKDTNLEQLDQLVQDGVISQETANAIRERIETSDTVWFGLPRGFGFRGFGPRPCGVMGEELAAFLGIDVPTLRSELRSGKSLAQIAEAHGKSRDELKAFLTDQMQARLDQAVANGRLTQEEADARLQRYMENLDALIDATPPAKGFGRGHRHGWFGHEEAEPGAGESSESTTSAGFRY